MDIKTLIDSPYAGALIGLVLMAVSLLVYGIVRWRGRTASRREIARVFKAIASDVLRDVLLPDGMGGRIHIDYLILTARGVLVLDLKDVFGTVFGSDQMEDWTVINGNQRFTIRNPQPALYDRVAAVKLITDAIPVSGRVAFTSNGEFTKGLPRLTTMLITLKDDYSLPDKAEALRQLEAFAPFWERIRKEAVSG